MKKNFFQNYNQLNIFIGEYVYDYKNLNMKIEKKQIGQILNNKLIISDSDCPAKDHYYMRANL